MREKLYEACPGKYTRVDPMLNPKLRLNSFFDHNRINLEINKNKATRKCSNDWKLNNKLLPWIKEEFTRNI